jgi:hypothetical protein
MNKEKRQRYNSPDNVFDDNDYDQMPPTINENENSFDALQGKKCQNISYL